jgi:glucokinase
MPKQQFIGIEIGGTKLQLVSADTALTIQQQVHAKVNRQLAAKGIQEQITKALEKIKGRHSIAATGVGFGGPVNHATGKISVSHQIPGWEDFDLKQWLQELTGAPVFIDNDANVAALGEAVRGAGKPYNIVFYMTVGSGIGGGLVLNKRLYHGAHPGEVEIGHVRLNKRGETLESLCSGWAVDKRVRKAMQSDPGGLLATLAGDADKGEARFLKVALKQGDAAALKILEDTADHLAFALSHVVHLFHPEILIIGGGLSLLGKPLTDSISLALPRYLMRSFLPAPPVRTAALGKNTVPVGALQLAKSLSNI